jgi:hypothetical protein
MTGDPKERDAGHFVSGKLSAVSHQLSANADETSLLP